MNHLRSCLYLPGDADVFFFSLGFVNDVDAVKEGVFQAAAEVWRCGQVRQVLLDDSANVQLRETIRAQSSTLRQEEEVSDILKLVSYLCVQIQVCELSVTDGGHKVAVHSEVHLAPVAMDGDVMPVQIIQEAASAQRRPTIHLVYHAAP